MIFATLGFKALPTAQSTMLRSRRRCRRSDYWFKQKATRREKKKCWQSVDVVGAYFSRVILLECEISHISEYAIVCWHMIADQGFVSKQRTSSNRSFVLAPDYTP